MSENKYKPWYKNNIADTLGDNQQFEAPVILVFFNGQQLPANFHITVPDGVVPEEGAKIGTTPDGDLVWEQGSVIVRSR